MKKILLASTIFLFLISIQIYGLDFSLGVYHQIGKTSVDENSVAPYSYEEIVDFSKTANGNFLQGLVHFKKFAIGFEYGSSKFFYIYFKYWEPYSYRWSSFSYKPKNLSALLQYNLIKSLYIQVGIGNYFTNNLLNSGSNTGYIVSISNNFNISKSVKIPLFLRALFLTGRGTPVVLTFGLGLKIKTLKKT